MRNPTPEARTLPDSSDATDTAAGKRARWPSRQTLFPVPESCVASADALRQAERALLDLGFRVELPLKGVWRISWPGSALTIWRYSPGELCQFVRDQALYYARHAARRLD
jgi:hypothetical protein